MKKTENKIESKIESKKFKKLFLPIYVSLAVLISCSVGLAIYSQYNNYIKNTYRAHLESVTLMMEKQFPIFAEPDELERLLRADADEYWEMQRTVANLQVSFGMRYVFVWHKQEDGWHLLLSSYYPRGTPVEKITELHREYIPVRERAFQTKQLTITEKPVTNQWGTFQSVFRPVVKDGEVGHR